MRIDRFRFGSVRVDGVTYDRDVVIDHGAVRPRRKGGSKRLKEAFGHTPLSTLEEIPWDCRRLVVGTGAHGSLPVTAEVREEANRRGVQLVVLPTPEAIEALRPARSDTNAVLHVTC